MSRFPDSDDDATKKSHMKQILAQSSQKIESLAQSKMRRQAAVLTGSTGSLGSCVLDRLLRIADVNRVFCLSRAGSDESRQAPLHEARGLATDFSRVTFLEADLSKSQLGLSEESYRDLILTATPRHTQCLTGRFQSQPFVFPTTAGRLLELACPAKNMKPAEPFLRLQRRNRHRMGPEIRW